ncbi:MAG: enoyl-CoA hydratase [Rhodospirillaceae bacterium]|nr:enoyl-CoA hydratase [Rhodospirillaceae bacterium]MDD9915190.1 enoyl-CoA hydratase [Rhodospirillaceae bacterium]MDD9926946.1 enoyl-CoA hydratase [Rhodospirillaceae bacterium]
MAQTAAATDTDAPILLREDADGVAYLTFNRPRARNALSLEMLGEMNDALDAIKDDKSIRAVVIAGNGPAFCAGHDIRQLRANAERTYYEETMAACAQMMLGVMRLPQPVIARVQGIATAAGCQLVATCDLAVAAEDAQFATPGVHIGLFCSTPMVALSRNVGRKEAMEMLVLGDPVTAARAKEMGLVNAVVPEAELDAKIAEMTGKITSKSSLTIAIGKEAFYRQLENGVEDAYAYASEVMVQNMMAEDAEEGMGAFIEKREPVWRGR